MNNSNAANSLTLQTFEEASVISNHSDYSYKGSENFEHDDTSFLHNY